MEKGFTLFIAIMIMGTLLLVSTGIVNLAVKQSILSNAGEQSQHAFYAADTGMECALYWDIRNPSGYSAFSTSTASLISCNRSSTNPDNQWLVGGNTVSVVNKITFYPDSYCAIVTVTKGLNGATVIESRGYNTCSNLDLRRVERAVRAVYGGNTPATLTASPTSVSGGAIVNVVFADVPNPVVMDWIGLYQPSVDDDDSTGWAQNGQGFTGWLYTSSCTSTPGSTAESDGLCTFIMPTTPGAYEFRLFANNGTGIKYATSQMVIVVP